MNFIFTEENCSNAKIETSFGTKQLNQSGLLVYEYNPLKVYRLNADTYVEDTSGDYLLDTSKNYIQYKDMTKYSENEDGTYKEDTNGIYICDSNANYINTKTEPKYVLYPKNSIVDLDTDLLEFDLSHPVDITILPSYDGSANLILNDGEHLPRLINTRFSPTGLNSYEIVDREGDNDTNIYDYNSFDTDISLYKKVNNIVKLNFLGVSSSGNLKVGNYVFYFKLADSDGNETDFVAESGIVSCYIGNLNDPYSIRGGLEDENCFKSVGFLLTNINSSYNKVVVYYTRTTGVESGDSKTAAYKLNKTFNVTNNSAKITITGFENVVSASIYGDINNYYNIVDSAKCLALCLNMLFLGNIKSPEIPYKELSDLSLRVLPTLNVSLNIGRVNEQYEDSSGGYEYYNVMNIYNKLGYWNKEIYRFGIVYILNDFTLSPAFDVRGINDLTGSVKYDYYPVYNNGERNYIPTDKETYKLLNLNENSKGVVRINWDGNLMTWTKTVPIGLDFKISNEVINELKKYTKGFFFVRQKRLKTTFCLAIPIGLDTVSNIPTLPIDQSENYLEERFLDDDRLLTHDFNRRTYKLSKDYALKGYAMLCPEYDLNLQYFNLFFTGSDFTVQQSYSFELPCFELSGTHFYNLMYNKPNNNEEYLYTITAVKDDIKAIKGKNLVFSSRAGESADASKIAYCGYKNRITKSVNLMRGSFGPYLGVEGKESFGPCIVDIKIPNYDINLMDSYFEIRFRDSSPFYTISNRFSWEDIDDLSTTTINDTSDGKTIEKIFRGDCYICNFTHRMIRNFLDSETPVNDDIVDSETWKTNYTIGETDSSTDRLKINRADVNAVKIGHWVTVKVCSNLNLSLRCIDLSYPSEIGLTGKERGFYPLQAMSVSAESKIPESFVHNAGLCTSVSDKIYHEVQEVPYIKDVFSTRIIYSDINLNDGYLNGYRVFRGTNYFDYPLTYGSMTKLLEYNDNLICVFEHAVAFIPINEKAISARNEAGDIYITSDNVLSRTLTMLSSTFGSQWADSVVKTPYGVYGIDTVAKKIWKVAVEGSLNPSIKLNCISDFNVQKFLNKNITLKEHEITPIIGIRNVKSHYNAFKGDVMFTYYDDINTLEERAWNLCFNEILLKFITFYSWIPSFSENIDNIFFTFDRNTSKNIAKLYCDTSTITLTNSNLYPRVLLSTYPLFEGDSNYYLIGTLGLTNVDNFKLIESLDVSPKAGTIGAIFEKEDTCLTDVFKVKNGAIICKKDDYDKIYSLNRSFEIPIKATLKLDLGLGTYLEQSIDSNILLATKGFIDSSNNTYFWKHGLAGLMKTNSPIKPCMWYGKLHPFEFEIVAVDSPAVHKIFTDLLIISNKVSPESLHFEISGDIYNFADDKKNMFFRQEALKNIYQYNGSDILYDSSYLDVVPSLKDIPYSNSGYKERSTAFPIYYSRVDGINEIEDYYQSKLDVDRDYLRMSGSEIVYDKISGEYKIATHIKACPFDEPYKLLISKERYDLLNSKGYLNIATDTNSDGSKNYYEIKTYGRLSGNLQYQESVWYILIPPIVYWLKNEKEWEVESNSIKYPPLNIANNPLPEDIGALTELSDDNIPLNLHNLGYKANSSSFDNSIWGNCRKETRIRDKYIKVKIRYTGDKLALIYALKTLYTVSYA